MLEPNRLNVAHARGPGNYEIWVLPGVTFNFLPVAKAVTGAMPKNKDVLLYASKDMIRLYSISLKRATKSSEDMRGATHNLGGLF